LRRFILSLFLLLTATPVAFATEGPPIAVMVPPLSTLPTEGATISVGFEILSHVNATITEVGFTSELAVSTDPNSGYWIEVSNDAPSSIPMTAMQPFLVTAQIVCNDPNKAVTIGFDVDGVWFEQSVFLVPVPAGVLWAEPTAGNNGASDRDESLAIPPMPAGEGAGPPGGDAEDARLKKLGPLRVSGRIMYRRPDFVNVGADGVLVRIYDQDADSSDLIASQLTDPWGNFDVSTQWLQNDDPDIYLQVVMANGAVEVVIPGGVGRHSLTTNTNWNFGGTHLSFGESFPTDPFYNASLHMVTTISRAWRFLNARGFGGIPQVSYSWPEDVSPPFYSSGAKIVHMNRTREYREATILHEYGHHFNSSYGDSDWDNYCNIGGHGDTAEKCGHLVWCPEDPGVAWNEGIAEFLMAVVIDDIEKDWGTVFFDRDLEDTRRCSDTGNLGSMLTTEGVFAAFAYDIADGNSDADDDALLSGEDLLNFGAKTVFDVQDLFEPTTPAEFLAAMQAAYPAHMTKIWATAANNGYNFDFSPPSGVTGFTSTSHATTGDDPNRIIDLVWNPVSDPLSGISQYLVQVSTDPGFSSGLVLPTGNVTSWSTGLLSPNTYYIRIWAQDNALNQSVFAAQFGPVTIRPATPADLSPWSGFWPYPVVPRLSADSSIGSAPLPSTLFGDFPGTYYNYKTTNQGEATATGSHRVQFYEDGLLGKEYNLTNLAGQTEHNIINDGPWVVRGGRHSLTLITDTNGTLSEADEDNNRWHNSFVWLPTGAGLNWNTRLRPPDAWGGFDSVSQFSSANCDAVRYAANLTSFHAVVLRQQQLTDDYDLQLFFPSSGPTSGFKRLETLAASSRPAGCLDAVVNNNALTLFTQMDVGIYDFGSPTRFSYDIRRFDSVPISAGIGVSVVIPASDYLALRSVNIPGGWPSDHATLTLNTSPASGTIHAAVIDPNDPYWGLDDPGIASGVTDENGQIILSWSYANPLHGIVIWQDPKDNPSPGNPQPISMSVNVGPTPPDLITIVPAGWYEPLVPSYAAAGNPNSVPFPSQLEGNTATTYFNAAIRNNGPAMAVNMEMRVYLDGAAETGTQITQLAGFTNLTRNYGTPVTVPGGRHTLSLIADSAFQINESNELNNNYGRQWIWSPAQISGSAGWSLRAAPPQVDGGWGDLFQTSSFVGPAYFNSDGLRTPVPVPSGGNGHWVAVASMGEGSSDVDLRLHEMGAPFGGFDTVREISSWSGPDTDYVLMNFRTIAPRQFDVGVTRVAGTEGYYYQRAISSLLGTNPTGQFGTYTLGSNQIVRLHEIWLDAGFTHIRLENNAGDVDWGMTLHRAGLAYQSRSSAIDGVSSWMDGGAGGNEALDAEVPESGYYCLAVYRNSERTSGAGRYYLNFATVTATPPATLPSHTQLVGATPNPFNPLTVLKFELSVAGDVELDIYDLRGSLVRRLWRGELPAGRHERTWNGLDNGGRQVASGVYLVQMRSNGVREIKKMSLLK